MVSFSYAIAPPALVLSGLLAVTPTAARPRVVPIAVDAKLQSVQVGESAVTINVTDNGVTRRYRWSSDRASRDGSGTISGNLGPEDTPVTLPYRVRWAERPKHVREAFRRDGDGAVLVQTFVANGATIELSTRVRIDDASLTVELAASRPGVTSLSLANPEGADVAQGKIPYSPIDLGYSRTAPRFFTAFLDWMTSAATAHQGNEAHYRARTDGHRNSMRERIVFTISDRADAVWPSPAWQKSRFYDRVGGRVVIDVVETLKFAEIERQLDRLVAAGLADCVVIVHVWQKFGYDNGLPAVLPPSYFLGGGEALRRISERVKAAQCDFALHQNYIDLYPNATGFDPSVIGVDGTGKRIAGWMNVDAKIGAFFVKPRAFVAQAMSIAPEIHRTLGTTASFIDVNSGLDPWDRVDMDARESDGGRFAPFLKGSKALFDYMQTVERGPVFGEGHHHFYWVGAVDGVEAQLSVGKPPNVYTPDAPVWVDFALRQIRPYQHNFGMGFYDRYAPALPTSRDPLEAEANRDLYRTQQIAFGHMPYRSGILWGDPRLYVQEDALAGSVARATANADAREIGYQVSGAWVALEKAFATGRQLPVRVAYANGIVVTTNMSHEVVTDMRGIALHRATWSAYGPQLIAQSVASGAGRSDYVRSPGLIYADPRTAFGNWTTTHVRPAPLIEFAHIRTNGQTSIRCVANQWVFLAFAARGTIDFMMRTTAIARPAGLRSDIGTVVPEAGPSGYWRARLSSGVRYVSDLPCKD